MLDGCYTLQLNVYLLLLVDDSSLKLLCHQASSCLSDTDRALYLMYRQCTDDARSEPLVLMHNSFKYALLRSE
jgi:hypothetical protein